MNVYKLEITGEVTTWDDDYGMVVVADNEDEARLLACEGAGDGKGDKWLDESICKVTVVNKKGVVLIANVGS